MLRQHSQTSKLVEKHASTSEVPRANHIKARGRASLVVVVIATKLIADTTIRKHRPTAADLRSTERQRASLTSASVSSAGTWLIATRSLSAAFLRRATSGLMLPMRSRNTLLGLAVILSGPTSNATKCNSVGRRVLNSVV